MAALPHQAPAPGLQDEEEIIRIIGPDVVRIARHAVGVETNGRDFHAAQPVQRNPPVHLPASLRGDDVEPAANMPEVGLERVDIVMGARCERRRHRPGKTFFEQDNGNCLSEFSKKQATRDMLGGRRASNLTRAALPASHWKAPDVSTADFFSGAKNSQCSLSEGRFSLMPVTSEQLPYIQATSAAPMMSQDGQTIVVKYALEGGKNISIALDAQTSNELLRSLAE